MRKIAPLGAMLLAAFPFSAFAATPSTFKDLAAQLVTLLDSGTAVLIVLGIVAFFWGVASNLFAHGTHEPDYAKLRTNIIWGIFIIFVMVSIWGIVQLLQSSLFSGQVNIGGSGGSAGCTVFSNCNIQR